RARGRRLRGRHPPRADGHPREHEVPVPDGDPAGGRGARRGVSRRRRRARVAAVVLPVEPGAGRGAALARGAGAAQRARRLRGPDPPYARRSPLEVARDELRVPVARRAGPQGHRSRSAPLPDLRRRSAARLRARDGAVRGQHPALGRAQRARAARRALHVRQRAPRAPLRHPGRARRPVPQDRARRRAPLRPVRQGQRADGDLVSGPDVAGAARRMDHGASARHAARTRAAERRDRPLARGRRHPALGARASRAASHGAIVQSLPRRHRSPRPGARKLRRDRRVARHRARQRRAGRSDGTACGRGRGRGPGGSAPGARRGTEAVRAGADGEAADVRARPGARVSRYADGARDRARSGARRLSLLVHRAGRCAERAVQDARRARRRRGSGSDVGGRGHPPHRRMRENVMTGMQRISWAAAVAALAAWLAAAAPGAAAASIVDAAAANDRAAVLAELDAGADPAARSRDGTTALHWAVYYDDVELVERLIAAGADVDAVNDYGSTPLAEAALVGNTDVVRRLLEAGAGAGKPGAGGQTARLLLEHGADPNARETWRNQTAVIWAAAQKQPAMIRLLLEHGADPNARSAVNDWARQVSAERRRMYRPFGGMTALMYAARE